MCYYHVGLPSIHVHTAVNTPPEVIFRLALPSKHCNSCREGSKSADSSSEECPIIIIISEIHGRRKRVKTMLKGNKLGRAKSENSTFSSKLVKNLRDFCSQKEFGNLKMLFSLANFILGTLS